MRSLPKANRAAPEGWTEGLRDVRVGECPSCIRCAQRGNATLRHQRYAHTSFPVCHFGDMAAMARLTVARSQMTTRFMFGITFGVPLPGGMIW